MMIYNKNDPVNRIHPVIKQENGSTQTNFLFINIFLNEAFMTLTTEQFHPNQLKHLSH